MRTKIKLDLNKIKELYIDKKLSSNEVAKIMNVGSETILRRLTEMGLKRNRSESLRGELNPFFGKKHSDKFCREARKRAVANGFGIKIKPKPFTEERRKKMSKISKRLGLRPPIFTGHTEKSKLKISMALRGKNSYLWKGGFENYRGDDWLWQRKKCYERDKWTCQICGKHCRQDIACHHIIPWSVSKDNSLNNLVTLCRSCHVALHNRMMSNNPLPHYEAVLVRWEEEKI